VYNAEGFIAATLREVHAWLSGRAEAWELIVIDDGEGLGQHDSARDGRATRSWKL